MQFSDGTCLSPSGQGIVGRALAWHYYYQHMVDDPARLENPLFSQPVLRVPALPLRKLAQLLEIIDYEMYQKTKNKGMFKNASYECSKILSTGPRS